MKKLIVALFLLLAISIVNANLMIDDLDRTYSEALEILNGR